MTRKLLIVYHGTNYASAMKILKSGFNIGTYFAIHLEDALGYGGVYVFEVAYSFGSIPKNCWQFITHSNISPNSIIRLTKYNKSKIIKDNMVLRHKVCMSNSSRLEIEYIVLDMKNNPSRYTRDELIAYGVKVL